jgi:hypothetical protein
MSALNVFLLRVMRRQVAEAAHAGHPGGCSAGQGSSESTFDTDFLNSCRIYLAVSLLLYGNISLSSEDAVRIRRLLAI